MAEVHRALDWLARRRDGESVPLIAWRAGVSTDTVRRATAPYGPFPRPSRHLGRTHHGEYEVNQRTARWIDSRRRGVTVAEIARREGVRHQYVSRVTVEHGPYPAPGIVADWVELRERGDSASIIAERYGIASGVVRRATRRFGPFGGQGLRMPDGVVGVTTLARRVGMSHPAVLRWVRTGLTPPPDFVTGRGRLLWLDSTITAWIGRSNLEKCPQCGALCRSLGQHRSRKHPQSGDPLG